MDEQTEKIIVLIVIVAVPALIAGSLVYFTVLPLVGQIPDFGVTELKIAENAVTTGKIADGAVALEKLSSETRDAISESGEIPANSITTEQISDRAITAEKLQSNSVSGANIVDGSITNSDISNDAAISDNKLAESYLQIAFGLSRGDKIYAGGIDFDESYAVGGKEVSLLSVFQNNIRAVIVESVKQGYIFEVDSNGFSNRTFKIKALYFNPTSNVPGPAIEVPADTNLLIIKNLRFIAIGT